MSIRRHAATIFESLGSVWEEACRTMPIGQALLAVNII